jgi:DNA-binding transcriptional LysR family regulator
LASDGDRTVDFHELQKHKLLLGPRGSNLRDLIDDAARRQGVNLSTLAELDGIRLAATLAFQGYAPAIVPVTAIPAWAPRGNWRVLNIKSIPPRLVGLAIRRRGMLSPAANAMRDVLRTAVRFQAPSIDGLIAI